MALAEADTAAHFSNQAENLTKTIVLPTIHKSYAWKRVVS